MIGFVTLGARDPRRAATYHDTLPAEIGARHLMAFDRGCDWAPSADEPDLDAVRLDGNKRDVLCAG